MYITSEDLVKHGACITAINNFKRLFPSGKARLTRANMLRYAEETPGSYSDLCWLVDEEALPVDRGKFRREVTEIMGRCVGNRYGTCDCPRNVAILLADMLKLK